MAKIWEKFNNAFVAGKLRIGKNGSIVIVNADSTESTVNLTELGVLDGLTASAAEINNACDGNTATAAEMVRACDVSARIVTLTGDTTIAVATHEGKTCLLGEVGGNAAVAVTLPEATGSGARYRFVVSVVNTSGYTIRVTGNDIMQGNIIANSTGDTPDLAQPWPTAADSDTITLNGTTTGGVSIGDFVEVEDVLTDTWAVYGVVTASGTEATPFSAAV